jgi:hypothetical protein
LRFLQEPLLGRLVAATIAVTALAVPEQFQGLTFLTTRIAAHQTTDH